MQPKINVATSEENAKKQKIELETIDKSPNESTKINPENKTDQDKEPVATKTQDESIKETDKIKKTNKDSKNIDTNTNIEKINEAKIFEFITNPESKKT